MLNPKWKNETFLIVDSLISVAPSYDWHSIYLIFFVLWSLEWASSKQLRALKIEGILSLLAWCESIRDCKIANSMRNDAHWLNMCSQPSRICQLICVKTLSFLSHFVSSVYFNHLLPFSLFTVWNILHFLRLLENSHLQFR